MAPSLASAIVIGLLIGALQGALVAYANIPAFIVTLGGLLAWRGVVLGLSQGKTTPITIPAFRAIGQQFVSPMIGIVIAAVAVAVVVWLNLRRQAARRRYGLSPSSMGKLALQILLPSIVIVGFIYALNSYAGVPIPVIILLAVALSGAFLTQNTTFGRYLYAIGGNPDAARLSGISLRRHIMAVFCVMAESF